MRKRPTKLTIKSKNREFAGTYSRDEAIDAFQIQRDEHPNTWLTAALEYIFDEADDFPTDIIDLITYGIISNVTIHLDNAQSVQIIVE